MQVAVREVTSPISFDNARKYECPAGAFPRYNVVIRYINRNFHVKVSCLEVDVDSLYSPLLGQSVQDDMSSPQQSWVWNPTLNMYVIWSAGEQAWVDQQGRRYPAQQVQQMMQPQQQMQEHPGLGRHRTRSSTSTVPSINASLDSEFSRLSLDRGMVTP